MQLSRLDDRDGRPRSVLSAGSIVATIAVAAATFLCRNIVPPFGLVCAYLSGALILASLRARRGRWLLYNAGFAFLALAGAEAALFVFPLGRERTTSAGSYAQRHFTDLPELGYGSIRERRVTSSQKYFDGRVVYDVNYTIDENGLRTTTIVADPNRPRALFFGCSFTFGEGVADTETMPALFEAMTGFSAINFGFHGYGPHQMLRALEIGLPQGFGYRDARAAVYTALPEHVDRAAGRAPWDQHGPKYQIVDGRLRYQGPFSPQRPQTILGRVLARWQLLALARTRWSDLARDERSDRATFLAIVGEADRLLKAQFGVPLVVLNWDVGPDRDRLLIDRGDWLKRTVPRLGIRIVSLSEHAPQLNEARYYIPIDGHPNGAAYLEAARVLANRGAVFEAKGWQ